MSLNDCSKCWDTPCTCGQEYSGWPIFKLEEHITMLQKMLNEKRGHPEREPDIRQYLSDQWLKEEKWD